MKVKSLSLSILAVSATTFATSQASLADRSKFGDPRWEFDPQHCQETKNNRIPYIKQPQAVVRAGSMPASSVLGLTPDLLTKPAAPAIVQSMAHTVAQPVVAAKTASAPQSFMQSFGNPTTVAPPVVAALPQAAQPQAAQPSSAPLSAQSAAPSSSAAKNKATTSAMAAWRKSGRPAALAAAPQKMPKAQVYAPGLGYKSGLVHTFSASSLDTNTAVSGVVVRK